jgi:hypothetical protein
VRAANARRCRARRRAQVSENPEGEEQSGRVDLVAILYILGGIPAIVGFIVILFTLATWFDVSA